MKNIIQFLSISVYTLILLVLLCTATGLFAQNDLYQQQIQFSPEGGFFDDKIEVVLTHESSNTAIYYTLDGSLPNRKSSLYRKPISIRRTKVVRAIAYIGKDTVSRIDASTYFIDEPETDWLTISLTTEPKMLFDTINGIFQEGQDSSMRGTINYAANYWDRREHFINVEIFDSDTNCVYRSPCGFKLFGGLSRTFSQKSIALVSRIRYGNKRFRYPFFEDNKVKKFKHLILRNAGSDWNRLHGRDAIIGSIVADWDIDKQSYRPCHVYLNGTYWGIYYLREKINTFFLASHHKNIHPDSIDLIEHRWELKKGTKSAYLEMLNFLENNDLSIQNNYTYLNSLMNIENYTDYKLLQIFIDNVDAGGNIKFWRADEYDNGRWHWILYDTDWGFGLMRSKAYQNNSLNFHTRVDGPSWPNPPWSTLILRKLLENKNYQHLFINRFCDHLNTTFVTDTMLLKIEQHYNLMRPEMEQQFIRWNFSARRMNIHYNRMIAFAKKRPAIMRKQLSEYFDAGQLAMLNVTAEGRGSVWINNHIKASYQKPYQGYYFEKVPVELEARPRLGYQFSHWKGTDKKKGKIKLQLTAKEINSIKAVFVPTNIVLMDSIIFNEISVYNKQTGDWLELYNATDKVINIEGWIIKNRKKEFVLPQYTIQPNDYLVIAKDTLRFLQVFPMYRNQIIGNFDFGLNKMTDKLELYTHKGETVDTFSYHINTPGRDFTIDLKAPYLDNGNREHWELKYGRGTPADLNPSYMAELAYEEQLRWVFVGALTGFFVIVFFVISATKKT